SLLDPGKGYRLTVLAEPEGSLRGQFSPYVRLRGEGTAYQRVGNDLILAGRVLVASIQGAALDDLAPSRRLYGGGGGSVRGFAYQQLGPHDIEGNPTGGRSLNEASLELRYRFGDYGIAAFADVGQVYQSNMPRFTNLRTGVGIGGRIYTNFGPMRVDLATPLKRRAGESRINVYVSIGQAF
ncbi:MAG: BamA/TamA family outer membrane protein, partial [Proteobacteria bacterium]|nr:BamA/TamA family outer membrane protein [Pseudomonadota bacterium]